MSKVFHSSLHGLSSVKERELSTLDLTTTQWSHLDIESSDFYLFTPQNNDLLPEYNRGWKVTDIFPVNSVGIVTGQDSKTIAIKKADAELLAKEHNLSDSTVKPILYRPFDIRHIVYDSTVVTRTRSGVMQHMLVGGNLGIITVRRLPSQNECNYFMVSDNLIINGAIRSDSQSIDSLFPLYLYPTSPGEIEMGITRKPNIATEFLAKLKQNLGYTPTPEAIFHYIYAIFHSPTYRSRYAEFLKIDFPRVPITRNVDLFRQLGELGEQLVNLHLIKSPILNKISSPFIDNGGGCIVDAGHPKYENGKVVINKQKDGFMDVPEAVWNFHVGGYQVCQKWLKDRKGRTLSQDDIEHYQKIVVALGQSIDLMAKIDAAIPNWPLDAEYN
jgi:predicted helicase